MSLATSLRRVGGTLIRKFGASVTLTYVTGPTLDAATGDVTNTESAVTVRGVVTEYTEHEVTDEIQVGDLKLTISAQNLATIPAPMDRVTLDSEEYEVLDVDEVEVGTTDVLYELQIRR